MPKMKPLTEEIRDAKFIQGLVDTGSATEAYKALKPHVKHRSASVMGSQALARIDKEDVNSLYQRIGCTKEVVLTELWNRMKKTRKDTDFVKGTSILSKVGGWEGKGSALADLISKDMDLVEIVKIRLRKRSDKKDLQDNVIDITPS